MVAVPVKLRVMTWHLLHIAVVLRLLPELFGPEFLEVNVGLFPPRFDACTVLQEAVPGLKVLLVENAINFMDIATVHQGWDLPCMTGTGQRKPSLTFCRFACVEEFFLKFDSVASDGRLCTIEHRQRQREETTEMVRQKYLPSCKPQSFSQLAKKPLSVIFHQSRSIRVDFHW